MQQLDHMMNKGNKKIQVILPLPNNSWKWKFIQFFFFLWDGERETVLKAPTRAGVPYVYKYRRNILAQNNKRDDQNQPTKITNEARDCSNKDLMRISFNLWYETLL